MTAAGAWTIALALAYTVALVVVGRLIQRRSSASTVGSFFVGGRTFNKWTVAFCITGLFSGSSFIAIMELSYRTGISAIWYGVAETVQVLLIALLLLKPLRERLVVTVTGIIGDRFGRTARAIAGSITAFTFPMWSVATAIAFASALHAFTDLSIYASIAATAVLLLFFLWAGGMRAVAFTQTMNCIVFLAMLVVGVVAFLINPGVDGLVTLAEKQPHMVDPFAAGVTLIAAWFGTFIVNVLLAQAAFQMSLSCRTPEEGRKGLLIASGLGLPLIILGVVLGTAAAVVVPNAALPLVAAPQYIAEVLPAPLTGVFFLGIWACALGWAGPCQFSGATSLGRDVGKALRPNASDADLVKYTRWSLVLLTLLMVGFAFLRTEQSAWWNVLAWTLRNGATLAPVLAAFFWPLATRRSAIPAMIAGFASGLLWYYWGGWSPTTFFNGIHPVWVGMSVNVAVMIVLTLVFERWRWTTNPVARRRGTAFAIASVVVLAVTVPAAAWLHGLGLSGLVFFTAFALVSTTVFFWTEPAKPTKEPANNTREEAERVAVS